MKVLTQNFKNGELSVGEYPFPSLPSDGALVATTFSAVSLGTERAVYQLAKANPLQKARKRPDLVRQVWNRAKNDGLLNTVSVVRNLVSSPIPLGYSLCGVVLKAGYRCDHVQPGDRVACGGFEYANHAEINAVPRNMIVKVPDGVNDEEAAFSTVASVSLQALRLCDIKSGDTVLIMGMGLLGHLCAALAEVEGARVVGYDPGAGQIESARNYCPNGHFMSSLNELKAFEKVTNGRGYDHTLICASSGDLKMFNVVGELTRDRGEVVVVGDVKCEFPRRLYYEKELQVKFSRAYGPGRYDLDYEKKGIDYPYSYVRWTMQRNMGEILRLLSEAKLDLAPLISHRFSIDSADSELVKLFKGQSGPAMGIVIEYPESQTIHDEPISLPNKRAKKGPSDVKLGLIGAGRFAQGILIPAFRRAGVTDLKKIVTGRGLSAVSAGTKFGAEEAVSSIEEVVNDPECNALLISTNHGQHADLICAGLAAGKHVFCEKPLCIEHADISRIEKAERDARGILMVGYNRRFSPHIERLREAVSFSDEPMMLLYRINAGAQPPDSWVHDEYAGGGRIVGELCHYVDIAAALINSDVTSVHATTTTGNRDDQTYYDNVTVTLKYENGSVATLLYVANGNTNFPKEYLEVHRADATGVLSNYRRLVFKGGGKSLRYRTLSQQKGFVEEAKAFVEGCRSGVAPIPMATMVETSRVTFAAMESIQTGMPVDMADFGPDGQASTEPDESTS